VFHRYHAIQCDGLERKNKLNIIIVRVTCLPIANSTLELNERSIQNVRRDKIVEMNSIGETGNTARARAVTVGAGAHEVP